jgi:hypothetical protein
MFIMFNTATKSAVLAYLRHLYLVSTACLRRRALNCNNEVHKKTTTRSV